MPAARRRLLFVLSYLPWPPRHNGVSIRFLPIIEHLQHRYDIDLVIMGEEQRAVDLPESLRRCRSITYLAATAHRMPAAIRRLRTLIVGLAPFGEPLGSVKHESWEPALEELKRRIERDPPAVLLWCWGPVQCGFKLRRSFPNVRFVFDLVDSPTLHSMRAPRPGGLLGWLHPYSTWKWRRFEQAVRRNFDAAIYISKPDSIAIGAKGKAELHVVPNGVYTADLPSLDVESHGDGRTIGFLGNMSYDPNIAAAVRLAQRILPKVRQRIDGARLLIIGRDPSAEVRALASDHVELTGSVPSIWPHIARVDVFAFPMTFGAGLQNKIIEAMYAGVPVVTTPLAGDSLPATHGRNMAIAASDEAISEWIVRLLTDRQLNSTMGKEGRALMQAEFDWGAVASRYERALLGPLLPES